jgi:hypothetical protein
MSPKHTNDISNESLTSVAPSQVYFISVGKHIKIGFTTNLKSRLQTFRGSSAEEITVLLTIPGGREVERRLHDLFREERIRKEFFRDCWPVHEFIRFAKERGVDWAFEYIEAWKRKCRHEWDKTKEQRRQERLDAEKRRTGWDGRLETYESIHGPLTRQTYFRVVQS